MVPAGSNERRRLNALGSAVAQFGSRASEVLVLFKATVSTRRTVRTTQIRRALLKTQ